MALLKHFWGDVFFFCIFLLVRFEGKQSQYKYLFFWRQFIFPPKRTMKKPINALQLLGVAYLLGKRPDCVGFMKTKRWEHSLYRPPAEGRKKMFISVHVYNIHVHKTCLHLWWDRYERDLCIHKKYGPFPRCF